MNRIDPLYLCRPTSRVNVHDETRIKATSEEVSEFAKTIPASFEPSNFITEIFYLTVATAHYGLNKTVSSLEELSKHADEMQRHLDMLQGDGSWQGVRICSRLFCPIVT